MARSLGSAEANRYRWDRLRTATGVATDVPEILLNLLQADSEDDAELNYWGLENTLFIQGQLFEAAAPATSVVMAGLADGVHGDARVWVLELLFQMVNGVSHRDEAARGLADIGEDCRRRAREGLWLVYRELGHKWSHELARNIVEILDSDVGRLTAQISWTARKSASDAE